LLGSLICSNCSSREYGAFKCVGTQTLNGVSEEKIALSFKKKDIIFKEHEKVTGFYCIESGVIRTYKTSPAGKIQTFQIASRGKWVGFRDVISGADYNHSAICLGDAKVCYISKETIVRLIKVDVNFQFEVMKYLADEWKVMEDSAQSLGTKQIHSRLAELLITFSDAANKDNELVIDVTREVMASCIGTTKETLIRSLSDFKDRNWIGIEKNKIELLNRKALHELAEIAIG
jgi:CRP/FNR family transcriptional regulator